MLRRAALAIVLAAGIAAGIALFPHALEPGRAESDGIALNLLVDQGNGAETNDWFSSRPDVRADPRGDYLRVRATDVSGYQLISRPLPVFPHHRYAVDWDQRDVEGTWLIAILDSRLRPMSPRSERGLFPVDNAIRDRYVFNSRGLRRITITFLGAKKRTFQLRDLRLVNLGAKRS
jgi:hypothetical protein